MEYELVRTGMELCAVSMTIPFPPGCAQPKVTCEAGEADYSARNNALVWSIPLINRTNPSGTLEFTVAGARKRHPGANGPSSGHHPDIIRTSSCPHALTRVDRRSASRRRADTSRPRARAGVDAASLFPIAVDFTSSKTFCELEIGEVLNLDTREPIMFASATTLSVESYAIV